MQVEKLGEDCSASGLYCASIIWQQIFKGSVQVMVAAGLPTWLFWSQILIFWISCDVFGFSLSLKKLDKIWIFMVPNSCLKLTNVDPYDITHEIKEQYRKICSDDRVNEVISDSMPPAQRFTICGTCTPRVGVTKLRLAGHIRPADRFNPTCQIPSTFFSRPRFRLWTAVQQHWL